ncbi:MAG: N-formylglutamate amidohydrolase [Alphaproteobacteria bacterium]|nr:N-formylglutamate amidohydrolase [Alphaproteobacteria bacterium]
MSLLSPGDPPPVTVQEYPGRAPVVVLCDHAGRAVPQALGMLGVEAAAFDRHIAYDIGALSTARHLSRALGATLVASGYSRLVIDCNRCPAEASAMPVVSDGTPVPGNVGLEPEERAARIEGLFRPYHTAIARVLDGFFARGIRPAILSMHSCTPVMDGFQRPWHIGILWGEDGRIAEPLLTALEAEGDLVVGDNLPYSGRHPAGFTVPTHAVAAKLPHVTFEIRQDLISDEAGCEAWADRLARLLPPILASLELGAPDAMIE